MNLGDNIKYNGYINISIIDNKTSNVISKHTIKNSVTKLWLDRLGAHLGGFGGVDAFEIRPYKILAFTNPDAAEYGLTSDQTTITNASSSGLTGNTYYSYGNVDISNFLNSGSIKIKGMFNPTLDGLPYTTYTIYSFRLATSGGTTSIGPWNSDQYCPIAIVKNGYPITILPSNTLVVDWIVELNQPT